MGDFSINHTLCLRLWGYGGRPLHPAAIGIGNLYVTDADGDGAPGATTQVLCLGTPVLGKMGRQKRPDSSLREVGTHPEHSIYMPQHAEIKRVNTEQKLPQPHFHPRIIWKRQKAKARVLFLPPYSPDLNPHENLWSKPKTILRKMKERTVERLLEVAKEAVKQVTPKDCAGYFKNCGY